MCGWENKAAKWEDNEELMIYSPRLTTDPNLFIMFTFTESDLAEGRDAASKTLTANTKESTEGRSDARENVRL